MMSRFEIITTSISASTTSMRMVSFSLAVWPSGKRVADALDQQRDRLLVPNAAWTRWISSVQKA